VIGRGKGRARARARTRATNNSEKGERDNTYR
jgi:hypothetical protein